jgi:nucleoside-diphosphate-sugar epimerase
MRVLVTGMGGELGTRVAMLLEAHRDVEAVVGIDVEPPRRHLRRAEFHRVDPRDKVRTVACVRSLDDVRRGGAGGGTGQMSCARLSWIGPRPSR